MTLRTVLLCTLLFASPLAGAKSLHWSSIHVDAQLARNGTLTIAETQTFVFDGDWNGGERTFNIREGQQFELMGLERLEAGQVVPLFMGDLSAVGHYQLTDSVLRWRSRLPSDPPFEAASRTYRIRYRLGGVLQGREGSYRLNHDFLFPDRAGSVEAFSLRLDVDPAWGGIESPLILSARNVLPGEGFIVTRELVWRAEGRPTGTVETVPVWHGRVASMSVVGGIVLLIAWFLVTEWRRGRFGRLVPTSEIGERWLRQQLFTLSPEAVGAAWDDSVGAPEVAAALASLVQQGSLETKVEKKRFFGAKLTMHLRWPRTSLHGHHRALVDKLFFGGRTTTDTDAIQKHYRTTGLDLAAIVKPAVDSELSRILGWNRKVRSKVLPLAIGMLVVSIVLLVIAGIRSSGGADTSLVLGSFFFGFLALAFGCIFAAVNRKALQLVIPRMLLVLAPAAPLIVARVSYLWHGSDLAFSTATMAVSVLFTLSVVFLLLAILRIPDAPERLELRRMLASGRRYLREQLRRPDPQLMDEWFPYILALGLGSNVDRWFRRFGPEAGVSVMRSGSSSFGSSSAPATWTGGGGGFGGAGASGAWVMAAAGVAAGVSKPGSSGGGGGGGGGSSSGGGGGGGW